VCKKREYAVLNKVSTTGWFTGCSESESEPNHLRVKVPMFNGSPGTSSKNGFEVAFKAGPSHTPSCGLFWPERIFGESSYYRAPENLAPLRCLWLNFNGIWGGDSCPYAL